MAFLHLFLIAGLISPLHNPEVFRALLVFRQAADVWSAGVTLYVMLIGHYPFEDPQDPRNFRYRLTKWWIPVRHGR